MANSKNYTILKPKELSLRFSVKENNLVIEKLQKRFCYVFPFSGFLYNPNERRILLLKPEKKSEDFLGLSNVLLKQALVGILCYYRRQLNIVGVGYQAMVEEKDNRTFLVLRLGYSHLVKLQIPPTIEIQCPKPRTIILKGVFLQRLTNFSRLIRQCKPPSAYKLKGIYLAKEQSHLKQGKKT